MATCLRLPMVYKPHPSLHPPSSPSLRRRPSFITNSIRPPTQSSSSSSSRKPKPKAPLMPYGMIEDDLFLSRLADVAEERPETFSNYVRDPNVPPLINSVAPPTSMASPAQTEYAGDGGRRRYRRRRKGRPPTLASLLLDARIVYIGLPFVPVVTELIVAQLMYLHSVDPYEPISLYINSTGTTGDDGEPLAMDSEGLAIYDALMQFRGITTIHTVTFGCAVGHACLLLAAGTKGKRFMFPHATVAIHPPVAPPSGLLPAIDAISSANELVYSRDLFTKLFARHTGNTVEAVAEKLKGTYYMDAREAKKFGVIDHVKWDNQEGFMKFMLPPEEYPKPEPKKKKKKRVVKSIDDY